MELNKRAMKLWKQTKQRNWSNASQGGQTALKEHLAEGLWSRKSRHPTPTHGNFDYPTPTPTPTPTPDRLRPSAVLLQTDSDLQLYKRARTYCLKWLHWHNIFTVERRQASALLNTHVSLLFFLRWPKEHVTSKLLYISKIHKLPRNKVKPISFKF